MNWHQFAGMLHAKNRSGSVVRISSKNNLIILDELSHKGWSQIHHIDINQTNDSYDEIILFLKNYAEFLSELSFKGFNT